MSQEKIDIAALLRIAPAPNTADMIFNTFSERIRSGELPEGYVFPSETALCEQLHVGRTSLREAYKALAVSGYITRTKRGTVVNDRRSIAENTPLTVNMLHASSGDFIEFRIMLEAQSAWLAAQRATDEDIADMERILADCIAACRGEDYAEILRADRLFHRAIATASKNSLIEAGLDAVASVWYRETTFNMSYTLKTKPRVRIFMNEDHREVLDAIIAHDAPKAREAIRDHIERVSHK